MAEGKKKGNAYERRISKLLGEWLYKDREALFRSLASGARATVRNRKGGKLHPGDIVPTKPVSMKFPLAVECKNEGSHKGVWTFDDLLRVDKKRNRLIDWWVKINLEAHQVKLIPWLIFTKNYHPDYLMFGFESHIEKMNTMRSVYYFKPNKCSPSFEIYLLHDVVNEIDGPAYLKKLLGKGS